MSGLAGVVKPPLLIKGEAAGTPDLDNSRVISEQARRVAASR
jgi:hypothetical protein